MPGYADWRTLYHDEYRQLYEEGYPVGESRQPDRQGADEQERRVDHNPDLAHFANSAADPNAIMCGRPSFSAVKSISKRGVSSLPSQA